MLMAMLEVPKGWRGVCMGFMCVCLESLSALADICNELELSFELAVVSISSELEAFDFPFIGMSNRRCCLETEICRAIETSAREFRCASCSSGVALEGALCCDLVVGRGLDVLLILGDRDVGAEVWDGVDDLEADSAGIDCLRNGRGSEELEEGDGVATVALRLRLMCACGGGLWTGLGDDAVIVV